MDPHCWPSLYPGIIVGALLGLGYGGWLTTLIGAIGGLAGAALGFEISRWSGLDEGFVSLAILITAAAAGALVPVLLFRRVKRGNP